MAVLFPGLCLPCHLLSSLPLDVESVLEEALGEVSQRREGWSSRLEGFGRQRDRSVVTGLENGRWLRTEHLEWLVGRAGAEAEAGAAGLGRKFLLDLSSARPLFLFSSIMVLLEPKLSD